jgi:hypothetical protein
MTRNFIICSVPSPNVVRYETVKPCNMNARNKKYIQNFSRNLQGKRPLGRSNCKLEDNIKMALRSCTMELGVETDCKTSVRTHPR